MSKRKGGKTVGEMTAEERREMGTKMAAMFTATAKEHTLKVTEMFATLAETQLRPLSLPPEMLSGLRQPRRVVSPLRSIRFAWGLRRDLPTKNLVRGVWLDLEVWAPERLSWLFWAVLAVVIAEWLQGWVRYLMERSMYVRY